MSLSPLELEQEQTELFYLIGSYYHSPNPDPGIESILIKYPELMNAEYPDSMGDTYTPLKWAVINRVSEVLVKWMVEHGANVTPIIMKTAEEVANTKKSYGADMSIIVAYLKSKLPPLSAEYVADQKSYTKSLRPDEKELLVSYTKFGDVVINNALRGNVDADTTKKMIDSFGEAKMDKFISPTINIPEYLARFMTVVSKAPKLKEAITVYRGIKREQDSVSQGNQILSTSWESSIAEEFKGENCCVLTINVQPGVKTIWMEHFSNYPHEKEILIVPPFKVETVKTSAGTLHVTISPKQYTRQTASSRRRKTGGRRTYRKKWSGRRINGRTTGRKSPQVALW